MDLCIDNDWCSWMSSLHSVFSLENFFFYFSSTIASVLENLICKHRGPNKYETFHTNFLTPHWRCSKVITKTRSNQTQDEFNECTWVIRDFYSIILLFTFYELIRRTFGSHNNHQRNSLKVRKCRLMTCSGAFYRFTRRNEKLFRRCVQSSSFLRSEGGFPLRSCKQQAGPSLWSLNRTCAGIIITIIPYRQAKETYNTYLQCINVKRRIKRNMVY